MANTTGRTELGKLTVDEKTKLHYFQKTFPSSLEC